MSENNKLKILFIPAWYPSEKNKVSGIFIREHAKAVTLYNHVIILYNEGWKKNIKRLWEVISDKEEEGLRTIRIEYRKSQIPKITYLNYLRSINNAFKMLLNNGWRPDIVHAHVYSAGVPAVVIGKKYKIPVIITEHWTGFSQHILKGIERFKAKFAMKRAQIVLTVSRDLEKSIRYYKIKNLFDIVPNTVNTDFFYPSEKKSRVDIKKILFVALLSPQKGVPFLLKALDKLRQKREDFILDIIGNGPNRSEYEKLSNSLGLTSLVRFHGLKTKEEVAEFMRNCDFFVQPSLYETFGVTYIEAMMCGKPIIATKLPVLEEKVNKNIGILVAPKDIDALTSAIDYMLDHYQIYPTIKIHQYAKENFSYYAVGGKLNKIYHDLIMESKLER